jgi:hypothetical protein
MSKAEAYAAYHDEKGQPKLVPSRVLFFDLLGVKSMSKGELALADLRRLRPTLERAIVRAMTEETAFQQASTWFTDNAVVAAPLLNTEHSEVLFGMAEVAAAYLQLICWEEGFLGRGAITFGLHYMDEGFVYGPALTEAVEIEQTTRWPRVTLGASAVDIERIHSGYYGNTLSSVQARCLIRDEEERVFVDCLGIYLDEEDDWEVRDHHLTRLRQASLNALANLSRYSEPWLKWRWLADYQNYALKSRHPDPERFLVPEDGERVAFASFNDPRSDTSPGSAWYAMDRMFSYRLDHIDDPPAGEQPGVYALYNAERERLYVRCAGNLHTRARADLGRTASQAKHSPLCRRVAEELGIATAQSIVDGTYALTPEDRRRVRSWLSELRMAMCETETLADARALEHELLAQFTPPLNR